MSIKKIDARGLSCPLPVVLASKAIQEGYEEISVVVDNEVAKENLLRLARNSKLQSKISTEGDDVVITFAK